MDAKLVKVFLNTDMLNSQFSPWPSFSQEEADAVSRVILSNKVNYWTGTEGREFEKEFASWAGSEYAVALGNGTLALDVALKAAGVCVGDEVITTSFSFIATIETILLLGAKPIFIDINPKTFKYYNDVYDHLVQVSENIDIYREMIWSLMDMYMTIISNKMNEIMKEIAELSILFCQCFSEETD